MERLSVNLDEGEEAGNADERNRNEQKGRKGKKGVQNRVDQKSRQQFNELSRRNRTKDFILGVNKLRYDELIHKVEISEIPSSALLRGPTSSSPYGLSTAPHWLPRA